MSNVKVEINRLITDEKEKAILIAYFIKNKDQKDEASLELNNLVTDEAKLEFLRIFLPEKQINSLKEKVAQLVDQLRKSTQRPVDGTADSIYIFIDNSNVYVEGKKETAWLEPVNENLVQIDYGKLVETVRDGRHMGAVPVVVGSRPPPEDTLWAYLKNELGYRVTVYDRNFLNREKEVDSEVAVRICITVADYVPGTIILIAGDGDYGPVIRLALDKNWTIEVWFWTSGLSTRLTKMDIGHPEYKEAFASRTTIVSLDYYYKKFMFAYGHNEKMKYLQIFTDLVKNSEIMECYKVIDLFGWWYRPNPNTLKLYVNTYRQWVEIKDLIMHKYPNAREVVSDAFFLEKNMYLSCLEHKDITA